MKESTISDENIKQLLLFMNRIKAFEKILVIQKDSVIRLIWGLLLFGAGLLDYVITEMVYQTESYGIFTLVPWVLAIFSGLIIQFFSERHLINIYSWEKPQKEENKGTLVQILGFILIAVLIFFFGANELHFLTLPSIALIFGFLVYFIDRKYVETHKDILNKNSLLLIPLLCVLAATIMILLVIIDKSFYNFHSVVFGTAFGGGFCLTAFWNRKNLENYYEKEDIHLS
ncbi:MAG: hypothetical protein ACW964_02845 [Candidatus Hodarchaeales archaeon]|jgi:hypothetical protein